MTKTLVITLFTVACASFGAAADPDAIADFDQRCVAISLNDTLPADFTEDSVRAICACLAEKVQTDPAVAEALVPGLEIVDFDERMASTGPVGQAAVEACTA